MLTDSGYTDITVQLSEDQPPSLAGGSIEGSSENKTTQASVQSMMMMITEKEKYENNDITVQLSEDPPPSLAGRGIEGSSEYKIARSRINV